MPDSQAPITAVLLDLDDTILHDHVATEMAFNATATLAQERASVDPELLIASVLRESAAIWAAGPHPEWAHGIGTSEVEGLRARFEGHHPHWREMADWGPGFRFESWKRALYACGVVDDDLARDLDARFDEERAAANPYMDGAEEALRLLGERYKLGMITNGIPDVQRTKIERTGLADIFDVLTISGELGYGKPDPRIYTETAKLMGVPVAECIMVGDNFRRDVAGGQEAGMRGVWLSLGREIPDHSVTPWLVIESLAELPDELQKLA